MIDFEKMIKETQDMHLNSTWSGSVYALKEALSYVDTNKDIAISSKVIIKKYLEKQIEHYKDLQQRTEIGKTLKGIEKKVGVEITQKGRKMKKNKPTHFAIEDIKFYAMDEENEIITNEKGEEVIYRLKEGIRFKPLEYLCEDMDTEIMEEVK